MGYYSIVAIASHPVGIARPGVLLDTGVNVFTAQTDDLQGFLKTLKDEGVTVQRVHQLDGLGPVPKESMLLPHECEIVQLLQPEGHEEADP